MVASFLLGLGDDVHTETLLDQLHGGNSITASDLQVMVLDDLEFISHGVVEAIPLAHLYVVASHVVVDAE